MYISPELKYSTKSTQKEHYCTVQLYLPLFHLLIPVLYINDSLQSLILLRVSHYTFDWVKTMNNNCELKLIGNSFWNLLLKFVIRTEIQSS